MSEPAVLQFDGMRVPLERGGASRKAKLTIEADGSVCLRAAADVAFEELIDFLAAKRDWLYRKLAEKEAFDYEPVTKELVDGEGFRYLGRNYRLRLGDDDERVQLREGRLVLPRRQLERGGDAIISWYQTRGTKWLRPRIAAGSERLRVAPGSVEVDDLGHKWGSATKGRIRIHWAALQLSPPLLEYIILHELAHLSEPHHGPTFWQLLGRVLPEYEDRKSELAHVGSGLWLGTIRSGAA